MLQALIVVNIKTEKRGSGQKSKAAVGRSTRTTQIVPEIIGPGGHLQVPTSWSDARVRMDRNTSDSTDDNMTTYHMMQRRFHE